MKIILSMKQQTLKEENMMIKNMTMLILLGVSTIYAQNNNDTDLDGVPDIIDECPNSPFLSEVNKLGCAVNVLTLPYETDHESLIISLGQGYSTNEDLKDREVQHNTKLKISYYKDNWGYTLQTGYYRHQEDKGAIDTILRIRKRIKISKEFAINIGTGVRLPSYDFEGNKIDELLYGSLYYYPTSSLSMYIGYNYTHIWDDEIKSIVPETPSTSMGDTDKDGNEKIEEYEGLQNTHKFYLGVGYFFNKNLYMNLTYSDESSKFVSEHNIRAVSSSLYYKIDEKWFATLYYKREVLDEDKHDNLLFTIGYHIW